MYEALLDDSGVASSSSQRDDDRRDAGDSWMDRPNAPLREGFSGSKPSILRLLLGPQPTPGGCYPASKHGPGRLTQVCRKIVMQPGR